MLVKVSLAALVLAAFVLAACGAESILPDTRLKPRGDYCYSIRFDPQGLKNTRWAWADDAQLSKGGRRVDAWGGVRIAAFSSDDDWWAEEINWGLLDGEIRIQRYC